MRTGKKISIQRERGYIMMLSLIFSVLSLSFTMLYYTMIQQDYQRKRVDNLINSSSTFLVQFSKATNESFAQYGVPEEGVLTVDALKTQGLLNQGFPSTVAFNQELKAYYNYNSEDEDVMDYIAVIEGDPDSGVLSNVGLSQNVMNRINKEIILRASDSIYNKDTNTRKFTLGWFPQNNKLSSLSNEVIDISHFGIVSDMQVGVYANAPEQVGYWKFQVRNSQRMISEELDRIEILEEQILFNHSFADFGGIINEGFDYHCPSSYQRVSMSQGKITLKERKDRQIKVCIEVLKSDVDNNIETFKNVQIEGSFTPSSPSPIAGQPAKWGNCVAGAYNDYSKGLNQPIINTKCYSDEEKGYTITRLSDNENIKPLNFNTYETIFDINSNLAKSYNNKFKEKNDFDIPVIFTSNTLNIKVGNRYVRFLTHSAEFVSSDTSATEYSIVNHKSVSLGGHKVSIQTEPFETNYEIIQQEYNDHSGMKANIETYYEYKNIY